MSSEGVAIRAVPEEGKGLSSERSQRHPCDISRRPSLDSKEQRDCWGSGEDHHAHNTPTSAP
jgi:hypothetical protein